MLEKIETDIESIVRNNRKEKVFWTLTEVVKFLSISQRKGWEMVQKGELKAIKVGGEWRIHVEWLIEYLKESSNFNIN